MITSAKNIYNGDNVAQLRFTNAICYVLTSFFGVIFCVCVFVFLCDILLPSGVINDDKRNKNILCSGDIYQAQL